MPIVTLTTDWGEGGFFAGMVKGALMSQVEGVRVVDITHSLEAYNVVTATFVVKHACMGFPAGTVHIIDVATQAPLLCVKARGQYYLCCDNGLPTMAFADEIEDASLLPVKEGGVYNFAAYTVFTRVAALLLRGATMRELGNRPEGLLQRTLPRFIRQADDYCIYIRYIDTYGNAYLGMTYTEFEQLRQGRAFVLKWRELTITELSAGYFHQRNGNDIMRRPMLTVSATGLLEIAIDGMSAEQYYNFGVNEQVLLRFR